MTPRRPRTGALVMVLALDLAAVAAVAAMAAVAAVAADRHRSGTALTAGASAVGFATWIPAAIAVGIRAGAPRSRRTEARARRLVHLGWTANTAGTLSVAALASSAEGPGSRPAVLAGALALGGAAASASYLELL